MLVYNRNFIRKLDDVYDINIITVITKDKDLTLDTLNSNREKQEKIIVEDSEKNKYEMLEKIFNQREELYRSLSSYEVNTDRNTLGDNCKKIMGLING